MKDIDLTPPDERRGDSLLLRWALRGLFVMCMMLIATVILSEPHVASRLKALASQVNAGADPATTDAAGEQPRPEVRQMPSSTVPVRRLND